MQLTYNPEIFSVRNVGEAKAIILTAETSTKEARWVPLPPLELAEMTVLTQNVPLSLGHPRQIACSLFATESLPSVPSLQAAADGCA
jgi:hypothetical protein